jgi:hypothetical protein
MYSSFSILLSPREHIKMNFNRCLNMLVVRSSALSQYLRQDGIRNTKCFAVKGL